jgi:8-amino-7-oxononanoate synthase
MTIDGLRALGFTVHNKTGFPIIYAVIGNNDNLIASANKLFEDGILVTVSPYPMVPKGLEGHRITMTSANTKEQVTHLLNCFDKIKEL